MGAALGSSGADTVVLHFDEKDVLVDYKINRGAKPGETPGTYRYVEPSFGGSKPAPAAKPAAAATPVVPTVRYHEPARAGTAPPSATGPAPAQAAAAGGAASNPATAAQPAAVQVIKPEPRSDSLPWWLPSSSTRGDRY
jgi:hypothetical protein